MGAVMRIPVRISARVEDGIPLLYSVEAVDLWEVYAGVVSLAGTEVDTARATIVGLACRSRGSIGTAT